MKNGIKQFIMSAAALFTALSMAVTSVAFDETVTAEKSTDTSAAAGSERSELTEAVLNEDGELDIDYYISKSGASDKQSVEVPADIAARMPLFDPDKYNDELGTVDDADAYSHSSSYLYNKMTSSEKNFYDGLKSACDAFLKSTGTAQSDVISGSTYYFTDGVSYSGFNYDRAWQIFTYFICSNPQYYFTYTNLLYSQSTTTSGTIWAVIFDGLATYSARQNCMSKIDAVSSSWMPAIEATTDILEKEKIIYTKIADKLVYDDAAAAKSGGKNRYDQTIAGALAFNTAICAAYAKTTSYFCNAAGIECFSVTGTNHEFNVVKLYDNWYELDVTWYDTGGKSMNYINKSYATFKKDGSSHTYANEWSYISPPPCNYDTVQVPSVTSYTVKFNTNGGSSVASQTITSGGKVTKPADPTKNGYTFAGWFTDSACLYAYDFSSPVTSSFTLYAKWTEATTTYKVTFMSNGSVYKTVDVKSGNTVSKPANPTRSGYQFGGWYEDEYFIFEYDFSEPVTSSFTLYAKWTEATTTYKVTFMSNGSVYKTVDVKSGYTVSKPADPTRSGYKFTGWYEDESDKYEYDFSTPVTRSFTLYAGWKQEPVTVTHSVVFVDTMSDSSITLTVKDGEYIDSEIGFLHDGYIFEGWYTDKAYTKKFDIYNTPITSDIILYSKWIKDSQEVTYRKVVLVDTLIGESVTLSVEDGTVITAEIPFSHEGYTLEGWYTDNAFKNKFDIARTPVTSNLTLYSKWVKDDVETTYTVIFDSMGGSDVDDQIVNAGEKAKRPSDPKKSGYRFTGWYTDEYCTELYNFSSPVTEDIILYAGWDTVTAPVMVGDNGFNDLSSALRSIANGTGDYVITISEDMTINSLALPKYARSLTIDAQGSTLTFSGIKTISPACVLTLQDMTISTRDSLTVTSKKDLTLENVEIECPRLTFNAKAGTFKMIDSICDYEFSVKGGSANEAYISSEEIIGLYALTGFRKTSIGGAYVSKTLSANELMVFDTLILTDTASATIKTSLTTPAKDSDDDSVPTIYVMEGIKPITLNGTMNGYINIIKCDSEFEYELPFGVGEQILKAKKFDSISKYLMTYFDEDIAEPGFFFKSGKVTVENFCISLTGGIEGTYCNWNDMITAINKAGRSSADYTIELIGDFDIGAALKLPGKNKCRSVTIIGNGNTLTFKGTSVSLVCPTTISDITVQAVNSKGQTVSWKLKGSSYLTTDDAELVNCTLV